MRWFFYNNLKVGVLGFKNFAVHEAILDLTPKYEAKIKRYKINTKSILKIKGAEFLHSVFLEDGTSEEIDGIFIAYKNALNTDFARKLGIMTEGRSGC